jgi:hypothetical protein
MGVSHANKHRRFHSPQSGFIPFADLTFSPQSCERSGKSHRERPRVFGAAPIFRTGTPLILAADWSASSGCNSMAGIDTLTSNIRPNGLGWAMKPISYARHCYPPEVIRHPVWLYFRFTLSYRDAEDILAERGIEVSNESIRRWVLKIWTRDCNEICVEHDLGLMINGISTRSLSRFPDSGYICGGPSK